MGTLADESGSAFACREHVKQAVLALTDSHKSLYVCGGACGAAASVFQEVGR